MKKLEDIPKKDVFEAPEGYFEQLPLLIQSRIEKKKTWQEQFQWKPVLQYATPVLILTMGLVWFLNMGNAESTEEMLASVSSYDIENYLSDADMTTEDLLDHIDFRQVQIDSMEFDIPALELDETEIDELLNELDTEI